jgi:hypothetical protein
VRGYLPPRQSPRLHARRSHGRRSR